MTVLPQSIRWRLPLTYVGIAFIATLILGAALLATLRGYYASRERLHLEDNAVVISETVLSGPGLAESSRLSTGTDQPNSITSCSGPKYTGAAMMPLLRPDSRARTIPRSMCSFRSA